MPFIHIWLYLLKTITKNEFSKMFVADISKYLHLVLAPHWLPPLEYQVSFSFPSSQFISTRLLGLVACDFHTLSMVVLYHHLVCLLGKHRTPVCIIHFIHMLFEEIVKSVIHTKMFLCSIVDIMFTNHNNHKDKKDENCNFQLPTPPAWGWWLCISRMSVVHSDLDLQWMKKLN